MKNHNAIAQQKNDLTYIIREKSFLISLTALAIFHIRLYIKNLIKT